MFHFSNYVRRLHVIHPFANGVSSVLLTVFVEISPLVRPRSVLCSHSSALLGSRARVSRAAADFHWHFRRATMETLVSTQSVSLFSSPHSRERRGVANHLSAIARLGRGRASRHLMLGGCSQATITDAGRTCGQRASLSCTCSAAPRRAAPSPILVRRGWVACAARAQPPGDGHRLVGRPRARVCGWGAGGGRRRPPEGG